MYISSAVYNHHVMNKMLWMSRQLRNFNDNASIISLAHAMSTIKNLLLPSLPTDQQSRRQLSKPPLTISNSTTCTWNISPTKLSSFANNSAFSECYTPNTLSGSTVNAERQASHYTGVPFSASRKRKLPSESNNPISSRFTLNQRLDSVTNQKPPPPTITAGTPKPYEPAPKTTIEGKDPHAPPTDEEFQTQLALLMSDAAKAKMKWDDYLTANRRKYPRCTKYFWCLPDNFTF